MHDSLSGVGGERTRAAEWSIGLDFGTAFSKAAATKIMASEAATLLEVRPLRLGAVAGCSQPYLVPSSIFLDRQRIHFGQRAIERLIAADLEDRELARSFKRVLGANDFEDALNRFPRPTIDPDRMFRLGELIVLYLAYLLALVDATSPRLIERSRVRFTRPGWIPERIAAAHEVMTMLFNQANFVHAALGEALLDATGVEYSMARAALDEARNDFSKFSKLDGGIYEASAVGLCHYSDARAPNYLMILDVGAGTTDAAALMRASFGSEIRIARAGRRTIEVAGDQFDAALMDLLIAKAKLKSSADRLAFKNKITPTIRDLKERLFREGQLQIGFRGRKMTFTSQQLERQPAFKAAVAQIDRLYQDCLFELAKAARREGVKSIGIVLAGGGSRLPALRRAILKPRWMGLGMRITHLPEIPAWVRGLGSAHDYEMLFSQVSAAFGAAISAPEPEEVTEAESERALRP